MACRASHGAAGATAGDAGATAGAAGATAAAGAHGAAGSFARGKLKEKLANAVMSYDKMQEIPSDVDHSSDVDSPSVRILQVRGIFRRSPEGDVHVVPKARLLSNVRSSAPTRAEWGLHFNSCSCMLLYVHVL